MDKLEQEFIESVVFTELSSESDLNKFLNNLYLKRKKEKRIIKFLALHKKAIIRVLIGIGLFICFKAVNRFANIHRGYTAVGGESFIFLMPFIIVKIRDMICDLISYIKNFR